MAEPTIPGELRDIHDRLDAGDNRMGRIEEALQENTNATRAALAKLDKLGADIATNNEMTKDIRDVQTAGRVLTKLIKWGGGIGAAVAGFAGAWYAVMGGGGPGIGPK